MEVELSEQHVKFILKLLDDDLKKNGINAIHEVLGVYNALVVAEKLEEEKLKVEKLKRVDESSS